jgi:hypothetical protein
VKRIVRRTLSRVASLTYRATLATLSPANLLLSSIRKRPTLDRSVLHVSYMVHVPYKVTRLLRQFGVRADYLAVGDSPVWNQSDYRSPRGYGPIRALNEFLFFWRVMARYEVVHFHFMVTMSATGWELPWLKRLGRKIVVHYRGCEARDRARNMALHPGGNICEQCDYAPRICEAPGVRARKALGERYGDVFLVTTPDMLDFVPSARWLPLFAIEAADHPPMSQGKGPRKQGAPFKIVHATNQPGIEGTERIQAAVERVRKRGIPIDFVYLHGVSHDEVLRETASADLTIGKMKMGYYANAQIESLALGVPSITSIRPEFMTDDLADSGLIVSTLDGLADTLEHYLRNPEALAAKRARARESARQLHDNERIVAQLLELYGMAASRRPDMASNARAAGPAMRGVASADSRTSFHHSDNPCVT